MTLRFLSFWQMTMIIALATSGLRDVQAYAQNATPADEAAAAPAATDGSEEPASAFADKKSEAEALNSDKSGGLPALKTYTKTAMALYQGDKVELRVDATGEGLKYRWVREDKTVCSDKVCQLDTKSWGLGKHLVVLVVYNKAGSRSVKYSVYILAPSPDMEPRSLTPEVVEPTQQPDAVKDDDLFVQSLIGTGYTYTSKNVTVVGRQRRTLVWDEKVRTTAGGVLVIGRQEVEEHFVLPSSLVRLSRSETERRVFNLQYGALRSRTLNDKDPASSIVVGDWLQVDNARLSDVIVAKAGMEASDAVEITSLRGFVRVIVQPPSDQPSKVIAAREMIVPAGTMVRVTRNGEVSNPLLPSTKLLGPYVRRSTPHYLPKRTKGKALEYAYASWVTSDKERAAGGPNLLNQVDKYLNERDPVSALELMLASSDKAKDNYDLAIRLGRAYQGLHLHKEAYSFYKLAIAAKPKDYAAHYHIGEMSMQARSWAQAIKWFNRAERLHVTDGSLQSLHYYRGVSEFWLQKDHGARGDLNFAVWEAENQAMAESARIFLSKLEKRKWWGAYARLGAVYDGNPLRVSADVTLPDGYEKTGTAYLGGFGLFVKAFRSDAATVKVGFELEKLGFMGGEMPNISLLDESLYIETTLEMGGTEGNPFVEFKLKPYLQLIFVGEERSDDVIGADIGLKFSGVAWQPEILTQTKVHQDPLPARDDILDPITLEPVVPSERSAHQSIFTLGITPVDSYPSKLGLSLGYEKLTYRNVYLKGDSFTTTSLNSKYTYFMSPRSILMPGLSYGLRNYADSRDSRKDTRLGVDVDWRWYYYSALYQDLWVSYLSQNSSRSTSTYSRMELGLAATWEL